MFNILQALGFMALGGLIVHAAWCHSWKMYDGGKEEGRRVALNTWRTGYNDGRQL